MKQQNRKCETCDKKLSVQSTFPICCACRDNRKCSSCGSKIGKFSFTGLCRSCTQIGNRPNREHETKIKPSEIMNITDVFFHLDFLEESDLSLHWKSFFGKHKILYKNIMYYTKQTHAHTLLDRINFISHDYRKFHKKNSVSHLMTNSGPVFGYISHRKRHPRKNGIGNLEWYQNKYGKEQGQSKFDNRYQNLFATQTKPYSKISQELFNKIASNITPEKHRKYKTMFATWHKHGEHRVNLNNEDKKIMGANRVTMFVDFKHNNKIIEFDGDYWHEKTKADDLLRDSVLISKGYEILRISESEYHTNKSEVVSKCLKFLKNQ